MCILINSHKLIKKRFSFLGKFGFTMTEYCRGYDLELSYKLNNKIICIYFYEGIDDDYRKGFYFHVTLNINGQETNLLKCKSIFDENILNQLSNDLNLKSVFKMINIYSDFIENHLNEIVNY